MQQKNILKSTGCPNSDAIDTLKQRNTEKYTPDLLVCLSSSQFSAARSALRRKGKSNTIQYFPWKNFEIEVWREAKTQRYIPEQHPAHTLPPRDSDKRRASHDPKRLAQLRWAVSLKKSPPLRAGKYP
jgi:hypothetical protein